MPGDELQPPSGTVERIAFQDAADLQAALEQAGGLNADPAAVLQELKKIQLGWPAEREFMALSLWSGRCRLIHPLDKDGQFPTHSSETIRVPDLFAVYEVGGAPVPVLIEVKSTWGLALKGPSDNLTPGRKGRLDFGEKYYNGLVEYSRLTNLPLLVAWKIKEPRLWFLFDITAMPLIKKAHSASFPEIFRADLLGVLLGIVSFQVTAGSRWEQEIARVGSNAAPSEFVGRLERNELISPTGNKWTGPAGLGHALIASANGVEVVEKGDRVVQTLYVPSDISDFSYRFLDVAVRGYSEEEIEWLEVLRGEKFSWTHTEFVEALKKAGPLGFIKHIIHPYPRHRPDWLQSHLTNVPGDSDGVVEMWQS